MRPAIYIPTFDGRERLRRALRALEAQSRPVNVVVIDNGSTDGTAETVHEEFPEAGLLELGRNLGFARALNRAVGGFDERIFLYYEDLDLALRLRAAGGCCELAGGTRAVHAYSASLGAGSGEKYARTGWSRGYMLRRYGVTSEPRLALRALAVEGTICAGQLLRDRTAAGLRGRLRGWREAGGLERRDLGEAPLLQIPAREALARRQVRRSPNLPARD